MLLVLVCAAPAFSGCGSDGGEETDGDDPTDGDGGDEDGEIWIPGDYDAGEDCSGYGYGDGCQVDGDELDCAADPCVFGECLDADGGAFCRCWTGYAGTRCERCAEGYEIRGLRCVRTDACGTYPCVYGTCFLVNDEPVCNCEEGYAGTLCDRCAEGYTAENLACVPEG